MNVEGVWKFIHHRKLQEANRLRTQVDYDTALGYNLGAGGLGYSLGSGLGYSNGYNPGYYNFGRGRYNRFGLRGGSDLGYKCSSPSCNVA